MTPEQQAISGTWGAPSLRYMLHPTQVEMRRAYYACAATLFVLNCARRLGKSYLAAVLAIECALTASNRRVWWAAPSTKHVRTITAPLMTEVLADCPQDLRPKYDRVDSIYQFPNGSQILLTGVNDQRADDTRGNDAHLCIGDEFGLYDDGEYLVESVWRPMALRTDGRILLMSTPAPTPAHAFTRYCAKAELAKAYACYTIDKAAHIPRDRIERFIEEAGGMDATSVRREYYCEHVVDDTLAVLPEWSRAEKLVVGEREAPEHFAPYVVADVGYHDLSVVLFGCYDFKAGLDVILDELVFEKKTAREIDEATGAKEEALGFKGYVRRYADAPAMVLAELSSTGRPWSGIAKKQTDGVFLTAATNDLRQRIGAATLRVHPRCETLIAHCRYAVWRNPGKDYERLDGYGHFDGVAALTYLVRVLDRTTNPYPLNPGVKYATHTLWPERRDEPEAGLAMGVSAFRRRR